MYVLLAAIVFLLGIGQPAAWIVQAQGKDIPVPDMPTAPLKIFLPMVVAQPRGSGILLGVVPHGFVGDPAVVNSQIHALDAWASPGTPISLVGIFYSFDDPNPAYNIPVQLETLWDNNYTGVINLEASKSSKQIAQGAIDAKIRSAANAIKTWASQGSGRFVYLAPLAEMNGDWTVWGMDPVNFKAAYARIQQLFTEQGVPKSATRWIFAPNGWSRKGWYGFESYYPGDSVTDIVGFSSYNFGYNPYTPSPVWQTPVEVYNNPDYPAPEGQYLDRMRAMAPTKPIFIMQTGTTAYTANGINHTEKNNWLRDAYSYLASYPGIRAIIYFNVVNWQGVDWPFWIPGDTVHQYTSYRTAVTSKAFEYMNPQKLSTFLMVP